jgi:hypothetical protein
VVGRPHGGHRFLKLKLWIISVALGQTGDQAEPLGGTWRQLDEKVGEWYAESRHLQGCSTCMCRLRNDGLAPVSKY